MIIDIAKIISEYRERSAQAESFTFHPYQLGSYEETENQVIVLVKPELCNVANESALVNIFELICGHLKVGGVKIGGVRVLSAGYIKRQQLIFRLYMTLNRVSKGGLSECSEVAKGKIQQLLDEKATEKNVRGSYQFLKDHPRMSPMSLELLNQNMQTHKIASGVYAIKVEYDNQEYVILNPFYPAQVEWFEQTGNVMVAFECRTRKSLGHVRNNLIGHIDPKTAKKGSVRHMIWENRKSLGLQTMSIRFNGVHVSPNLIEGMFSIPNFFNESTERFIPLRHTVLGQTLLQHGYSQQMIEGLEKNPVLKNRVTLFDQTENLSHNYV